MNLKVWTATFVAWCAITYALCFGIGLVLPAGAHSRILETLIPAYQVSVRGFFMGLVWSAAYGAYAAVLLVLLHRAFHRRLGPAR